MKNTDEEYDGTPYKNHKHYVLTQGLKLAIATIFGILASILNFENWWINQFGIYFLLMLWINFWILYWRDKWSGWL